MGGIARRGGLVALLLVGVAAVLPAQTAEERARIQYEAAKLALAGNQPEVALAKLEEVRSVLGDAPELLYFAAEAAFRSGQFAKAREHQTSAFAAADDGFRASETYGKLLELAARLELLAAPGAEEEERKGRARRELEAKGIAATEESYYQAVERGDFATRAALEKAGVGPGPLGRYLHLFAEGRLRHESLTGDAMLRDLVRKGALVTWVEPCHYAAQKQPASLATLAALIDASGGSAASPCYSGSTLLSHLTFRTDWPEAIAFLVARGAPVDRRASGGWTPLWESAYFCRPGNAAELLKAGADVGLTDTPAYGSPRKPLEVARDQLKAARKGTSGPSEAACRRTVELLEARKR